MALRVKSKLSSRSARLALAVRRKPYDYTSIAPGVSLGYRRTQGAGTWVLRTADGKGGASISRIASADDLADADGEEVLDFWQACERARVRARGGHGAGAQVTWAKALDDYEADLEARAADTVNASRVRRHLTPALSGKLVASLTAVELRRWRDGLIEKGLARGSVLRTIKSAAAALNHAADLNPRITNRQAWKTAFAGLTDTYQPVSRVIGDADVLKLVAAAYALDANFGLLVDVLASTGTRLSQAIALQVGDLQENGTARLLMPSSRKGRGRKPSKKPVPIPASLARKLAAAGERAPDAPLLTRPNGRAWDRDGRPRPAMLFGEIAAACGIECTAYSLRHASIVRSLIRGVPIRITAQVHDTSVAMIEKTYSAYILDHADTVARRGLLDTDAPASDNVVAMAAAGRR
jgi:integrase